jgi:dipeptidyl aminopeptidase/acylaminoacyl peptidase
VPATLTAAGTADASTLVYVCGRDLCTSDDRARDRERLTPDGARGATSDHPGAIVLFNAATGAVVRELTRGPRDSGPVFSPDGRSVASERSGGIWRVPVAGGRARRVVRSGRQPAWGR